LDWSELKTSCHETWLAFYRNLLALRHETITPRLSGAKSGRASFSVVRDNGLEVHWQLGDGSRLQLLANMGPNTLAGLSHASGQLIYATSEDCSAKLQQQSMPPWSVAWFLHP
jgi:1,4-alpha-glucan branching enzyme